MFSFTTLREQCNFVYEESMNSMKFSKSKVSKFFNFKNVSTLSNHLSNFKKEKKKPGRPSILIENEIKEVEKHILEKFSKNNPLTFFQIKDFIFKKI